jgi:DNA-binding CsgD family transcriptional regulator
MLLGEPGIGKTRCAQALSEFAGDSDVATLWGRCQQEPGAPPLWPWAQVLRGFAQMHDARTLGDVLGRSGSYLADICPDLRDLVTGVPVVESLADASQARFRLFDVVSEFWKRVASAQPLLLILEDLHWADIASLQLFDFLTAELATTRLLLVGTARDAELGPDDPVAQTLAELVRRSPVQRLALHGLAVGDTAQLLEDATGVRPSDTAIVFVHSKTNGNPLFIMEIASFLSSEQLLAGADAISGLGAKSAEWQVPVGIRALIGRRLDRLSNDARRALRCAAVIGTQFSHGLLRRVLEDWTSERLLAALNEALAAAIVATGNHPGHYQFAHVLTRDALYDELPWLERARLHERIALAMEDDHRYRVTPPLAALAHHFNAALPSGPGAKAIDYATRAGEQARAGLVYEEAVGWFRVALNALGQTEPLNAGRQCRLSIALASAQAKCGHTSEALAALNSAAKQAGILGASGDLLHAAIEFEDVAWRLGLSGVGAVPLLQEALRLSELGDDISQTKLRSSLVRGLVFAGLADQAALLHEETLALARRAGDAETLERALRSGFWLPWDAAQLYARLDMAQEAMALARRAGNRERLLDATVFRLHLLMAAGDFVAFSSDLEGFTRLADEVHQPFHRYHARVMRAAQALYVGRFADADELARDALAMGRRMTGMDASGAFGMQMFTSAQARGQLATLAPLVEQFVSTTSIEATWRPALILMQAELGQFEDTRAGLEQLAREHFRAVPRDSLWLACLAYLAQACVLTKDEAHADVLYELISPWTGRNLVAGSMIVCYGPADRYLGMLGALRNKWETAARHFETAIDMSRRQGASPWLALAQHDYAVMLLERGLEGDEQRVRALATSALALAQRLGMQQLKEGAERLLRTQSPRAPAYSGGLSRREAEVLRLLAVGKSNQEIASAIFRSPNTVASHVRNILAKLGAANRTEAAMLASRNKLL